MPVNIIAAREQLRSRSDRAAAQVRERLRRGRTPAFNLIAGPGAGKTLLLEQTLQALNDEMSVAVITADSDAQEDAHRLARHTGRLVQAVVGHEGCHLDATQIERALEAINLDYTDLLLIENVGNVACPVSWDLGEHAKIVLYPVTEGDGRAPRYAEAFRQSDFVMFTKVDLLPHVPFDFEHAAAVARDVNPDIGLFRTSAQTGEGMREWYDFLRARVDEARLPRKRARRSPSGDAARARGDGAGGPAA